MTRPHLLFLAFWFPPSRASGVYRALALVQEFTAAGWDVTVLTCDRRFLDVEIGSTDDSLLSKIPERVVVERVPFSFRPTSPVDVRAMSWLRASYPSLWNRWMRLIRPLRRSWDVLQGRSPLAYPFSDPYVNWIDPVVTSGIRIANRHEVDCIVATGNPFSSFEAARLISRSVGCQFVVDYRDPWSIDVFTGQTNSIDRSTAQVEEQIVREAARCVHVNQAIADMYGSLYPPYASKQVVVPNGYDQTSIGEIKPEPNGDGLTFGMLGTMNDRWPMEAIFEGWRRARDTLPPNSRLVFAGHLGYFAHSESEMARRLPNSSDRFYLLGPVQKSNVAQFYSTLDVVILPVPGGPLVTSGKVFEAAALGIPVVCVQEVGGGARKVLNDHPMAFCARPSAEEVKDAFVEAAHYSRRRTYEEAVSVRSKMAAYERRLAMKRMVDVVQHVTSGKPATR